MSLTTKVVTRHKDAALVTRVASRFKAASNWEGKFVGKDARLQWSRNEWFLEELPQKGKTKLRQATLQSAMSAYQHGMDEFLWQNLLPNAKLSTSDDYDKIKDKIMSAMEKAVKEVEAGPKAPILEESSWIKDLKWYENKVFYLKVTPEGIEPFDVVGKDFTLHVKWDDFKVYSPDSDVGGSSDPSYTYYDAKSPQSARVLYKLLDADRDQLKSTAFNNLGAWLTKNKVNYGTHFSSWH